MKGNTSLLRIPTNNCSASQQEGKKNDLVCDYLILYVYVRVLVVNAMATWTWPHHQLERSILTWSQETMSTGHTASLPHPNYILTDAPSQ